MTGFRLNGTAVSAVALLAALGAAGAAEAQVTAQQVWDDWKAGFAMGGASGVTVGSEVNEGGVLTVTDLGFSSTGEDGSTVTGTLASLVFTENGDGTVTVTTAPEMPITVSSPGDAAAGEPATDVAMALRQTGLTMNVSGSPGALAYDLAAQRYALELDSITQDGAPVAAEALLAFNNLAGSYTSATGAMRDVDYDVTAQSMDLLLDATSPEDGATLMISGQLADLASRASVTLPLDMSPEAADAALANGLAVEGGYTYGQGNYLFEFADASGPTSGTISVAGGELGVDVSAAGLGYETLARGVALEIASAALPIPVTASIAEYGVNVEVPTARTDAPADWALGVNLTDLDLNDEVWGLFDPSAVLPRDPATLIVDLTGTATLLFDLMDPAQAEAMAAAPMPAEVNSVSLNDLNVSVAGAQVTGTGSFTLDNADTTTFPGMPRPEGTAELQMSGVNGLIDNLVAMGLLPPDQVMGARMMLGLIAVPGEGEDQLVSRIEVTADGQVLANGQRLR